MRSPRRDEGGLVQRQQTFGYTHEELKLLLAPMALTGKEAIGSMGTDTPIAVLSARSRLLYDYFKQLFAQVTNPPLDAIREELVTALGGTLGPEGNIFDPKPSSCRQVFLPDPILDDDELARLIHIDGDGGLRRLQDGRRAVPLRGRRRRRRPAPRDGGRAHAP